MIEDYVLYAYSLASIQQSSMQHARHLFLRRARATQYPALEETH